MRMKLESQAKEVELPCEVGVGLKKRKGISTPIERAFGVEIRDQLDQEIARMFYTGGLLFNLARNTHYFRGFQFAANNKIDGYVPPGYNKLRTTLLQKEKDNVHRLLKPLRSTWKEKGVTIVSDGWSDPTRKPLINFMATSGNGPLFLKAVNCFGEVKDRFFVADLMKEVISAEVIYRRRLEIIQVTINITSVTLARGSDVPKIQSLTSQSYQNLCEARQSWIKEVHEEALAIKNFIMNHNVRLSIFTKLLSVVDTRFASIIVMLKRLKLSKRGLQGMVISEEWFSYTLDDTVQANLHIFLVSLKDYILNDKPCLHLVYEMWDAMIEKVKIEIYKKEKCPMSQISCFYDVNNTPLHCLAHSLHPRYYSDVWLLEDSTRCAPHRDGEISKERMKCFRRLFPNDDEYSKVLDEYAMFSMKTGPFDDLTCISKMGTMEPKNWWVNFGAQAPLLQTLAFRLLGQPTSSSCAERNWSTYAFIHSLKRNKLTPSRAQDLVYIYNNLRVLSWNPNPDAKMWDVGGDAFDSMEDVGFLEVADLSLDEPDFENDLIIDS
ncbi:hypothetical protein OSB04_016413 [Centaurea solstitialis]|uniref:Uncharacterized protein n=1 Tax=Centaurea solstitialis TaxID=347529 RepID=A0AA38TKX4_9ASTR|nr:hypothetical protein OSB04_016413 [Centaurea solstitialis]